MAKRGLNEGSIRQRQDGRFEVRLSVGRDYKTGRQKRISAYANSQQEAVEKLQQLAYEYKIMHATPTTMTTGEWLDYWLTTYAKPKVKQSTYASYYGYINNHFQPAIGSIKLRDLSPALLQGLYDFKRKGGLSSKTIVNMNLCLHKALDQAVLERLLISNPSSHLSLPRGDKPEIEVLTREQQARLVSESYKHRYGVFVRLVLSTGLRIGELLALQWGDISIAEKNLRVRHTMNRLPTCDTGGPKTEIVIGTPKSKSSLRSIPLLNGIVQELEQWRAVQENDAVLAPAAYKASGMVVTNTLGGWIEQRTFKDYYNTMLAAAELPHFTFHALRHTFATRALEQKMDAKTLSVILGHSSVSFTLDTYSHVLDDHKREEMQRLESLFFPPKLESD